MACRTPIFMELPGLWFIFPPFIQRNFEPLQRQVELWRKTQIIDERAKLIFYSALRADGVRARPTLRLVSC